MTSLAIRLHRRSRRGADPKKTAMTVSFVPRAGSERGALDRARHETALDDCCNEGWHQTGRFPDCWWSEPARNASKPGRKTGSKGGGKAKYHSRTSSTMLRRWVSCSQWCATHYCGEVGTADTSGGVPGASALPEAIANKTGITHRESFLTKA